MQLIVITPDSNTEHETDIVNKLFEEGLMRLHLRKPLFNSGEYRKYIQSIDVRFHQRIVLCGCFELCIEFEIGGIHLNSAMRSNPAKWSQFTECPSVFLSASFHSWQEIADNAFEYGYVFISPVFDSISKEGYNTAIDLAGAEETKSKLKSAGKYCPAIIGLGGVGERQIAVLQKHGFNGAAMLGAIWLSEDPVKAFRSVMSAIKSRKGGQRHSGGGIHL